MNKKGQVGVGTILIVAIAVIVCLVLITDSIADNVSTLTTKQVMANKSYTFPNSSATVNYVVLEGQAASGVIVSNTTGSLVIPSTNYTVQNYVVNSQGQLESRLVATDLTYLGYAVKIYATTEPYGYDTNSGGRAIASLIVIFCAIALVVVVLVPIIKDMDIFDW